MTTQMPVSTPSSQAIERFHTVCKRVLRADPAYFPRAEYRGQVIYFCTESCLDVFLADPERFYCAHSRGREKDRKPSVKFTGILLEQYDRTP